MPNPTLRSAQQTKALQELLQDDDVSLPELARVIRRSPTMTRLLLREVNKIRHGRMFAAETVEEAIVYLGLARVREVLGYG